MFDGDILFTTSNQIIINGISDEPAIVCEGKSADKKSNINKDDFIKCIKDSFGNKVGSVTNVGSSFYDTISKFEKGTKEYDELNYRIQCIQYVQQECIDSAKNGKKPRNLPSTWTDNRYVEKIEDKEKRELYESIVTERKPYYFIYIYDSLYKEHMKYDKATKNKCERLFRCDINTLKQKQKDMMSKNNLTKEENNLLCEINEFLYWYEKKQIVSNNPCMVNKIAKIVEDEFDDNKRNTINKEFDYSIYMSDNEEIADRNTITKIKKAYEDYKNDMKDSRLLTRKSNDLEELEHEHSERDEYFKDKVMSIIPDNQILLNTMLELSYKKTVISKTLTWIVCGDIILDNMLARTNNKIQYPIKSDYYDFEYNGIGYNMKELELKGDK